jgi:NAD(P)-dependent dehydrogenase (short-subunit alcohol dehydrogenase family)
MSGTERLEFGGKSLLITGGSQGIGAATARLAARRGARVMIASPDAAKLAEVTAEIRAAGGTCAWVACDVTKPDQVAAMVRATVEAYGSLDLAYNNAGVSHAPVMMHEVSDELWQHTIDVNVTGVFYCCREQVKAMIAQGKGGAILVNGSMAGIQGVGTMAPYSTSKHAVAGLVKSIAVAYGQYGIRCNFQGPGATETPMYDQAVKDVTGWQATHGDLKIPGKIQGPLARNQSPEEQAEVACFLLSDAASAMTGAIVIADCGATAY